MAEAITQFSPDWARLTFRRRVSASALIVIPHVTLHLGRMIIVGSSLFSGMSQWALCRAHMNH